jgi:hypothetical protein
MHKYISLVSNHMILYKIVTNVDPKVNVLTMIQDRRNESIRWRSAHTKTLQQDSQHRRRWQERPRSGPHPRHILHGREGKHKVGTDLSPVISILATKSVALVTVTKPRRRLNSFLGIQMVLEDKIRSTAAIRTR